MTVKLSFCILAAILALLTLSACKEVKHTGAAALAYDFVRTGITPGKKLPKDIYVVEDPFFTSMSSGMGLTTNTGANLYIILDKNKLVTFASIEAPGTAPEPAGSVDTGCLTQDGRSIFALTQEEVKKLYGTPSWTYVEDTNPPPRRIVDYYYRFNADTYIVIGFDFPMQGKSVKTVSSVSAGIYGEDEVGDTVSSGKAKIYDWPLGLHRGIRKPTMEFEEQEPSA